MPLPLRSVYLFRTMLVNPLRHPQLSTSAEQLLKQKGFTYLARIRAELETAMGPLPFHCEQRVRLSADWAHEVLIQANHLKTQLILLGVSERSLAYRVFHSGGIEKILRETPCDVGIYRGP